MQGRSHVLSPATLENTLNEKRWQSASSVLHLPIIGSVDFPPPIFDSFTTLHANVAAICCSFPPRLEVLIFTSSPLASPLSFAAPPQSAFFPPHPQHIFHSNGPVLHSDPPPTARVSLSGLVLVKAKLKMIAVGLRGLPLCFQRSYMREHKSAMRGRYVMTDCALSAAGKVFTTWDGW